MTGIRMERACGCTCGDRHCASNRISLDPSMRDASPEAIAQVRKQRVDEQRDRLAKAKQAQSIEAAAHHFQQWTGWELELITRTDITVREMARLTGRTFYAVRTMRKRLRREKALQAVAS